MSLKERLSELQCPVNWKTSLGRDQFLKEEEDRAKRHAHPWSKVVSKLNLAYQFYQKGHEKKCKSLLVECYIPLVEEEVSQVGCGCDLIKKHKVALKHVLDALWVYALNKWNESTNINSFIDKIIPHSSMSNMEKAALYAIRARVDQDTGVPDYAETATVLDPTEGQWHFYLSTIKYLGMRHLNVYYDSRLSKSIYKSALMAYNLRKSPETVIFLAQRTLEEGNAENAASLYREAIKVFPDSLYSNLECGMAFYSSPPPIQDLVMSRKCFRKALEIGDDCLQVHLAYGQYLMRGGKSKEAKKHLMKAAAVHSDAIQTLHLLENNINIFSRPPQCTPQ